MFRYWNDISEVSSSAPIDTACDIVQLEFIHGICGTIDVSVKKETCVEVCSFLYFANCFDFAAVSQVFTRTYWLIRLFRVQLFDDLRLPESETRKKKKYFPRQALVNQSLCFPFIVYFGIIVYFLTSRSRFQFLTLFMYKIISISNTHFFISVAYKWTCESCVRFLPNSKLAVCTQFKFKYAK